jgi:hypothetical protein
MGLLGGPHGWIRSGWAIRGLGWFPGLVGGVGGGPGLRGAIGSLGVRNLLGLGFLAVGLLLGRVRGVNREWGLGVILRPREGVLVEGEVLIWAWGCGSGGIWLRGRSGEFLKRSNWSGVVGGSWVLLGGFVTVEVGVSRGFVMVELEASWGLDGDFGCFSEGLEGDFGDLERDRWRCLNLASECPRVLERDLDRRLVSWREQE